MPTRDHQISVLSVKQPWAWAIIHAGKDIENRSWSTRYRGRLYIHASKRLDRAALADVARITGIELDPDELECGGIIGHVELQGVWPSDSRWAIPGYEHWRLSDPTPVPFQPLTGNLGIFKVGPDPQLDLFG